MILTSKERGRGTLNLQGFEEVRDELGVWVLLLAEGVIEMKDTEKTWLRVGFMWLRLVYPGGACVRFPFIDRTWGFVTTSPVNISYVDLGVLPTVLSPSLSPSLSLHGFLQHD